MTVIPTRRGRKPDPVPKVMLPVKITAEQRRRFKRVCVDEDLTYGDMIVKFLDERDARLERQRRAQVHPFHQPKAASHYPGGGAR